MPEFIATRGTNCRRYFDAVVTAATPEEAFEKAKVLMGTESALEWTTSAYGHKVSDDLSEPCCVTEDALSIVDESGEVLIDFTDVPNDVEPASYGDLLAFARRMARMATPEDELVSDPQGYDYHAFMAMAREARALLKFPKED